ncbi:MAG: efflux RND transporter periplasmic adaptor subunit [Phyllobacteriaceae bacterium]|nr:efflux RND transporter periplasmic adaptor subunit [Phyllobacteriaceae bacterium]
MSRVPVTTMVVEEETFPIDARGLGTVQPLNTVSLRSRIDGAIDELYFREGQTVSAGDLLLHLDDRAYEAALDQALAKKTQDEATLHNLELDLDRITRLAEKAYATQQQLSAQQASVAAAKALLQADDAAIETARVQLSYAEIRAPITGRIGFRQVDVGNIVRSSDQVAILTIVQVDPVVVVFSLPEKYVDDVRKSFADETSVVRVLDREREQPLAQGRLTVIDNQVDATTGMIRLKAEFANADGALWPGRSVTATLHLRDLEKVPIVPASAVQRGQDGLYAWIVDAEGKARIRPVGLLAEAGDRAAIGSGVRPGEKIVVFGQYRLSEGVPVDAHDASAPTTASNAGTTP